jgi:C_GCAxxG_C_C family probable redox protein
MDRCELANDYHKKGFNCAQSVLLAFGDLTGLPEAQAMSLAGGFGSGTGTGELCGAVAGAVMTLGLLHPISADDPVGGKKRTVALSKELQSRFSQRFNALRCSDLLQKDFTPDDTTPAARDMGLTGHCAIMIVTAVELVEEMLREGA